MGIRVVSVPVFESASNASTLRSPIFEPLGIVMRNTPDLPLVDGYLPVETKAVWFMGPRFRLPLAMAFPVGSSNSMGTDMDEEVVLARAKAVTCTPVVLSNGTRMCCVAGTSPKGTRQAGAPVVNGTAASSTGCVPPRFWRKMACPLTVGLLLTVRLAHPSFAVAPPTSGRTMEADPLGGTVKAYIEVGAPPFIGGESAVPISV